MNPSLGELLRHAFAWLAAGRSVRADRTPARRARDPRIRPQSPPAPPKCTPTRGDGSGDRSSGERACSYVQVERSHFV